MEFEANSDDGFTLVELSIAMLLSAGVFLIIAVMASGIFNVQSNVMDSSHSSLESQTFAEQFKATIRSATATQLSSVTSNNKKGQLLVARVLVGTDAQNLTPAGRCQEFLWLNNQIYAASTNGVTALPAIGAAKGWTTVVAYAQPVQAGAGIFSQAGFANSVDVVTSPQNGLGAVLSTTQTAPDVPQVSAPCF